MRKHWEGVSLDVLLQLYHHSLQVIGWINHPSYSLESCLNTAKRKCLKITLGWRLCLVLQVNIVFCLLQMLVPQANNWVYRNHPVHPNVHLPESAFCNFWAFILHENCLDQRPNVKKWNLMHQVDYTDKWYINGKRNAWIEVRWSRF